MSEKRSNYSEHRKLHPIQSFFISCSGADKDVIAQCPIEWNKYTGFGAAIFFTGIFAALSGGYALYSIFKSTDIDTIDNGALLFAIPFGLFWGAVIFNLDRLIICTYKKTCEKNARKRFYKELIQVLPRIILAVIIAITISKPIEVRIFKDRIVGTIQEMKIKKNSLSTEEIRKTYLTDGKEKRVDGIRSAINGLNVKKNIDPQDVIVLRERLKEEDQKLTYIRKANEQKISDCNKKITDIRNDRTNYESYNSGNLVQKAEDEIYNQKVEIHRLRERTNEQKEVVNKIQNAITVRLTKHNESIDKEIETLREEESEANVILKKAQNKQEEDEDENRTSNEKAYSNQFITQLDALGELTKGNKTMRWASRMITLLFLTVELAPILTKMNTTRSSYDEIFERFEYEDKIEQREIISRKNSEINELLRKADEAAKLSGETLIIKTKDKLEAERQVNKKIVDEIMKKQEELALLTIREWHKAEKAKRT
jgi:hypothetical protein